MRRAARTDENHVEVTNALRKVGATVASAHQMGMGFPDLVVGYRGKNFLMELKDGNKPAWERKLNKMQVKWHEDWRGQVCVVESVDEALQVIGVGI